MSLLISSLNSGSNGNCYYVGNADEAVLIDAGISCREIERRMERQNLSLRKVKAIFISHEHGDHIKGVATLSKKHQIPVYITPQTLRNCSLYIQQHLLFEFSRHTPTPIGKLLIRAFAKFHDAAHPHSFVVEQEEIRIGVFTDLGRVCEHLIAHFKYCDAAFLETNYCEELLKNGRYPYFLKSRISGGNGHLSNKEALALFTAHRSPQLQLLLLSHLSKDNNHPQLVSDLFEKHSETTKIVVASRDMETNVYSISKQKVISSPHLSEQISLF